jgi:hypothetical protein
VRFGTHMLAEEADDWWVSLLPTLEQDDVVVSGLLTLCRGALIRNGMGL